jgi:hypothetical protein
MLGYIIYKFEQTSENIITKSCFIIRKGLTKYNKCNGVMPMKTHIDSMHTKLLLPRGCNLLVQFDYITFGKQQRKGLELLVVQLQFFWASNPSTNNVMSLNKSL